MEANAPPFSTGIHLHCTMKAKPVLSVVKQLATPKNSDM
jgi:hypothetical protein